MSDNACIVIACCPVCDVINFEICFSFRIKPFSYMTKNSEQKLKYLKNKKSFKVKKKTFFIIFNESSGARNCLKPESAPLKLMYVQNLCKKKQSPYFPYMFFFQFVLINYQPNALFASIRLNYVGVNFLRIKWFLFVY